MNLISLIYPITQIPPLRNEESGFALYFQKLIKLKAISHKWAT